MKNVTLSIETEDRVLGEGESDGPFLYTLRPVPVEGEPVPADIQQKSEATSVTFTDVAPGRYTAVVEKLGVQDSVDFEVEAGEEAKVQVPRAGGLKVSMTDSPATIARRAALASKAKR